MKDDKYEIKYDEKNRVLRAELHDKFDPETAASFFKDFGSFSEEQQRYCVFSVHEDAQKMVDKDTRKVLSTGAKDLKWQKIAIKGAKSSLRMVAKIVLIGAGKGLEVKFFDTDEETYAWLNAERNKTEKKASQ
ncbi:hypothetical protein GX441_07270 [bacterium]|nr:hypothetical protein [bacterium]